MLVVSERARQQQRAYPVQVLFPSLPTPGAEEQPYNHRHHVGAELFMTKNTPPEDKEQQELA